MACTSELPGALLPYPLAEADVPTHWGSFDIEKMGHFYFFGGLFALLFRLASFRVLGVLAGPAGLGGAPGGSRAACSPC